MNVVQSVLHFGITRGDAPALIEGDRTITFRELAGLVRRTASHLTAQGLRHGDRIGLCLQDTADQVVALLATTLMGAVAAPLDWRARPVENARFVDGCGLACVLSEPNIHAAHGCLSIALDDRWRDAVARAEPNPEFSCDWGDAFVISATSGSTGQPKFTVMTHRQYYFAIAGMFELMALAGPHRFLCTMPLYYSGGRNSCMAHLLRGDCVVLYSSLFSPAEYVEVAERLRITVGGLVPSVVRQLLSLAGKKPLLPRLAALFSTGAPLYAEEKRAAARALTQNFYERYGTAETLAISILRPEDFADRPNSVGQSHSLAQVEIVDDNDRPLPTGAIGRLRYSGPGLASPLPGAAEEAFRSGWFYPGEIARVDDAGYIFLQGRTSDVIMRSGAKVYPAEVEATLLEHSALLDAAVVGDLGADVEETVIAFVVAQGGLQAGELLAHCRARLSAHKVPGRFCFLESLPKNTAGKTDKKALARLLTGDVAS